MLSRHHSNITDGLLGWRFSISVGVMNFSNVVDKRSCLDTVTLFLKNYFA